ncbi:MAG TPA: phosphoribosyltransferase family protein [Noviherbaspirillum sp.]|uniref:phosphoribosyltransferase n=1 Tax=Noviherbaspirillum sp. TaxID=1926288 RepID=UPI002B47B4E6|nr:phosphoribosyltransferase family protein [Noviherbaspirillum sp.]HJV84379.1 phosphoribosyltransferase family protein [Noviherbaspirillum sp.]
MHLPDQFDDRVQAAKMLVQRLEKYRGRHPLVLAIPRGALPMAKVLADELDGELDVVLVHKFGAPYDPEFALGAVDETGWTYLTPDAEQYGASRSYVQEERQRQLEVLKQRRARYTPCRPPIDPKGRIVIVVDDGIATGATMIAALHATRAREPAELVCAVPVAALDSLEYVKPLADKVVCILPLIHMGSVGRYYRDFRQVEDEEVIRILSQAGAGTHHDLA